MPYVFCKVCKKKFYTKPSIQNRGYGKYCSRECTLKVQRKGQVFKCAICKKSIWRAPAAIRKSKSGKFFCSKKCQTQWRNYTHSGENHSLWAGGISVYRKRLLATGKMPICTRCGEKDIRVLTVHHKNKNRRDNDLDNLMWLCLNCHNLVHKHNEKIENKDLLLCSRTLAKD